jgi:hypothetical protein
MPISTNLNYTADVNEINSVAEWVNKHGTGMVNPELFYSKQLLDTIRIDGKEYVYYRLATESPIQDKADKLVLRRWAPLEGHTVPLMEGIPPNSDKSSLEKYEITANQYGRYMEFTDKVDFQAVDPVILHYTREYSLVVMETLDMLARETLFATAQRYHAGGAANFEALQVGSVPTLEDLRLITLGLKRALVRPIGSRYHVIASPEFYYDMVDDPTVEKYMTINQSTKTMYENGQLVPLFNMEFYETLVAPASASFVKAGVPARRLYRADALGTGYEYLTWLETDGHVTVSSGYVQDRRTGQDASYIPQQKKWDLGAFNADTALSTFSGRDGVAAPWSEFKVQHVLVCGKDALTRTGLAGEGNAKMYTKAKGSTGVLDPIDQRQSIGFKINSVGFGSTRLEAAVDYLCVPTNLNNI